ncbi:MULTISPECIES: NfeD family protein [Nocardioides]|uniref:Nodulation protein NfeD n=1 Tax=Nocardioides vastitatis TaxID=2568655 RepID=A0ABW0ZD28_9ACTN|nr:NfeD family protein [Nocardioides sp.]THJ08648.1 nodulation protein NfeD [Nocardioides sp.]
MITNPAPLTRRVLGLVLLVALAVLSNGPALAGDSPDGPRVLVTEISTPITPVVAEHLGDGMERADDGGYAAYVIELDTPGGLVDAMRDIINDILASPVPVIVYVSPKGARAGSAGALITFASHVAVMAPGATIGAATPVGLEGEKVSDKIVNDAAAQAQALAELRNRSVEFAVDTVREGRSAAVDEAVELGAVDAKASSLPQALDEADGMKATVAGDRTVTVRTADASVDRYDLGLLRQILQVLADPNVAFLLLTLGTLGLIYELATPGVGVAGATGITALLLALFSLSVLPVNAVGLLLLAVAAGLFVAEVLAPGVAGFGFGGAVVLVLAAVFLFDDAEGVSVDLATALPLAGVMFVLVVIAGRVAVTSRREPSMTTGTDVFTGRTVPVREASGTTGRTFTQGAWWALRSVGGPLAVGRDVRVVGVDGLTLLVDPDAPGQPEPAPESERGKAAS